MNLGGSTCCFSETIFEKDCGCHRRCELQSTCIEIQTHILDIREMTKDIYNMYIKGSLLTGSKSDLTQRGKKRSRSRAQYTFNGKLVCKETLSLL